MSCTRKGPKKRHESAQGTQPPPSLSGQWPKKESPERWCISQIFLKNKMQQISKSKPSRSKQAERERASQPQSVLGSAVAARSGSEKAQRWYSDQPPRGGRP